MAQMTINFKTKVSWWVKPYLYTLHFFCDLYDCEPDYDKVTRTIMRGIKIKVAR